MDDDPRRRSSAANSPWSRDLEDVHFNIEKRLTALVGDAGKRLHTGRSRNDQVATDLRLWLRGAIDALVGAARRAAPRVHRPGRDATPTRSCPASRTCRSRSRSPSATICSPTKRCSRATPSASPTAAGASTGCRWAARRSPARAFRSTASAWRAELGFEALCGNSLDAVSDRDFAIEFTAAAALAMVHVSRFAEELVLVDEPALRASSRWPTASAPARRSCRRRRTRTCAELVRGKTGRVNGHLVALLTLMKGQPLAYNRDNQEDKEPLFDTVDTLADTLAIMTDLVAGGIAVNAARMREAARRGLRDGHRPRRLPRPQGRAVPRRARGGRARRAPRGGSAAASSPTLPLAELQSFAPRDRRRRLRGADARRLGREPQPSRRHRARPRCARPSPPRGRALDATSRPDAATLQPMEMRTR